MELPPKMTDILQVMDLVVDGPLKDSIRKRHIENLVGYFTSWEINRLSTAAIHQPLPPFQPPKPSLADGLDALFQCSSDTFTTDRIKAAMSRTFVRGGLKKSEDTGEFAVYEDNSKLVGMTLDLLPSYEQATWAEVKDGNHRGAVSLSEITSEVVFANREEDEEFEHQEENEQDD